MKLTQRFFSRAQPKVFLVIELTAGPHEFRFSGDHVDCVISSIDRQKAEEWLERGAKALFLHTITATEDDLNDIEDDPPFIGNYRDLVGAVWLEGCELHNGTFEFTNAAGVSLESLSMESSEFGDYIDDIIKIDPETHLIDGEATVIVRTFYRGDSTYNFVVADPDDFGWYAILVDMGSEEFIGRVNVNCEDVPPGGSGRYEKQMITLNVPDGSGGVRSISHSERSEDV